jgi:hypothetical protein
MRATKTRTLSRPVPPQQLFEAALGVVQNGKYDLLLLNNDLLRLGFVSGKTALSWGQEYLVEAAASGGGATLTVVCGSIDEAPKALMDGWKGGKAADKFVAAVESVLDGTTTAPVTPTESFGSGE